jgi:transcriptional regulator with XRE-family HTH domain
VDENEREVIYLTSIRAYRERMGWTQEKLAERCGVVKQTVSMWENGDRKPDIIMVKRLAGIFGCTTDDLLATIEMKEGT